MVRIAALRAWFTDLVASIEVQDATRAYIIDVMSTLGYDCNLHGQSIVLAYYDACSTGSFSSFKRIGDWVLWVASFAPESIEIHREVNESIGRLSYYACHRILNKKWYLYEELADDMPKIVHGVQLALCATKDNNAVQSVYVPCNLYSFR
jgi:hypothetical protein